MGQFVDNLKSLPPAENVVLLRLFDAQDRLVSLIPNMAGKSGPLRVFHHIAGKKEAIDADAAGEGLRIFGEYIKKAQNHPGRHQKIEMLMNLKPSERIRVQTVRSSHKNLLQILNDHKANAEETEAFIELLNQGLVRAAEKINGVWEPQTYAIDGVLFPYFDRNPLPRIRFASMMQYDLDNLFPPQFLAGTPRVERPFGRRLVEQGLKQFRLTETQKYAHVTFFYNGGYREPLDRTLETYHLIASDQIQSFAQKPAMKAREIADQAVKFIQSGKYSYGLINFANADMVGHTGQFEAAVNAVEAVDQALGEIVKAVDERSGLLVITADHGNAEEMEIINPKTGKLEISAKHSLNPVPFLIHDSLFDGSYRLQPSGKESDNNLSQVAATNFILMGLEVPDDIAPPLFI